MYSQSTSQDSMISTQMPPNTLYTPYSNTQEPLLQQPQDNSFPPTAPKDMPSLTGFEKLLALENFQIEKMPFRGEANGCSCCCGGCDNCCSSTQYNYKISDLVPFQEGRWKPGTAIFQGYDSVEDFYNVWCPSGHRAFETAVRHIDYDKSSYKNSSFLKLERKFKCSFLCLARPEMIVSLVEGEKNERIGRIINPIQCGVDFRVRIYDANESLRYVIKADCCACGVTCPGSCSSQTGMTVYDGFGNVEALLTVLEGRRVPEGASHSFSMIFPKNANGAERALLIAAIMMIGKTFFEANDILANCCKGTCACLGGILEGMGK